MTPDPSADRRRRILGAACLVAAPVVVLTSSLLRITDWHLAWTLLVSLWVLLELGSVLAIVGLLRERADRLGLAGGVLCFIGLTAAAGMMAVYRLAAVLEAYPETSAGVQAAYDASPILLATIFMPGLTYPLGLIVLAVGLLRARVLPPALAATLVIGAILFPVGRIPAITAALIASDLLVGAVKLYLARRVLAGSEPEPATSPASVALPVAG